MSASLKELASKVATYTREAKWYQDKADKAVRYGDKALGRKYQGKADRRASAAKAANKKLSKIVGGL